MSAILGILSLNETPCAPRDLEQMFAALSMYGKDAAAVWCDHTLGLGMRLQRITPQDQFEQQPVYGQNKQIILVADARLDDRAGLARELNLTDGSVLPDSALILRAYEKWNTQCVKHLIGDFCIAVWDARVRTLFLARAPLSSRALFYHTTPQTFAFASMPKGLHALSHIPRTLDQEYLADYLTMTASAPETTWYRGITRLLPGQSLQVRDSKIHTETFWQLDLTRQIFFATDDEYLNAFEDVLERAVGDALVSTKNVGIMVSGGMDSSALATLAAPLLAREGKRLAGFTEVPRQGFDGAIIQGRYADETQFVQALARRCENLDLNLVRTDGRHYLEGLTPFFDACETPFRNASNRPWYEEILCQAQAQRVNVLLNGGQGNLTISWYGDGLLPQLISQGHLRRAWREADALARRSFVKSAPRGFISYGVMPLLPAALYNNIQRVRGKQNNPAHYQAYSAIQSDFYRAQRVAERAREKQHKRNFRARGDQRQVRADTLIGTSTMGDGMGAGYQAMFGVEQRAPTADQRIVEFCFAVPEEQFLRDGQRRWLIQRAMQTRLPPEIRNNTLRGLQAADWYERSYHARDRILQELALEEKTDLAARALDLKRLRKLVEQMPEHPSDAGQAARDYRFILEIGLMTARFVRWVETGE